jgi:hypothetical protein
MKVASFSQELTGLGFIVSMVILGAPQAPIPPELPVLVGRMLR